MLAVCGWLAGVAGPANAASPWLLSEGMSKLSSSVYYSTADAYWDRDGVRHQGDCRSNNWSLNEHYEYGYSYYHTLFAEATVVDKACGPEQVGGVGDLRLGVRGRLNLYQNGKAWEASVIVPSGYSRDRPARLGYGRFGVEVGFAMRFGVREQTRSHGEYGASVRLWEGPPADQTQAYLKWSQQLSAAWDGWVKMEGNFSLRNAKEEPIESLDYNRLSDYDVVRLGLGLQWTPRRMWSVDFALYYDLWGRNTGCGTGVGISVSRTWE